MERVGEHPVPAGPLAVRWLSYSVVPPKAGTIGGALVEIENAGSATWRSHEGRGVLVSYHWLDERGNAIVWDGLRFPFERAIEPGERVQVSMAVLAPIPPGRYRLAFDLVDEGRLWFAELGNTTLDLPLEVAPRIDRRALSVSVRPGPADLAEETNRALAAQEEPLAGRDEALAVAHLAAGCLPAPDWSRRVLDAHEEGFAAVGGSIEPIGGWLERRRAAAELEPWAPGSGRNPNFSHPLLCPSLVVGAEAFWLPDVAGLPALEPPAVEPWLYDGRIAIRARLRSDRRRA